LTRARGGTTLPRVRIAQTFHIAASPERVFDYMTDPANLRDWQTSKTCGATSSHCPDAK